MNQFILPGDCREVMASLPDASVDAVVTDPPYELGFMGKRWDDSGIAYDLDVWGQCLRVLKPGGHMVAFGGTRTWHRLASAIEDAGFEVRDSIAWLYGSGFPKSLDVSKAIDKAAGAERTERVGPSYKVPNAKAVNPHFIAIADRREDQPTEIDYAPTAPATDAAREWQGWGTALKPAHEPIVVARKPLTGTVAANVLEHGTGALNIDACRIGFASEADEQESKTKNRHADFGTPPGGNAVYGDFSMVARVNYNPPGRWPANVILDEDQAAELDRQSGVTGPRPSGWSRSGSKASPNEAMSGGNYARDPKPDSFVDGGGGASRFFYVAKAPASERPKVDGTAHPTVKPITLMRYLCRLVTPKGGTILDPFAGSGATVEAAILERFHIIAIEKEADYLPLIHARIERATREIDSQLNFDEEASA